MPAEPLITLAAGDLIVDVAPQLGGRVARFDHKVGGARQPIFTPITDLDQDPAAPISGGCYPLVPFSNRIAGGRLAVLVMGTSDLVTDLQGRHTPDRLGLVTGLGLCLLAARAHGLAILDGVHLDLDDDAGFAAQCRQGVEFGFDGKTLIHPKTIAAANAHFGPDPQAVAWAERIIAAHGAALDAGQGIAVVDGKLIENLHIAEAERTLALAAAIAARVG